MGSDLVLHKRPAIDKKDALYTIEAPYGLYLSAPLPDSVRGFDTVPGSTKDEAAETVVRVDVSSRRKKLRRLSSQLYGLGFIGTLGLLLAVAFVNFSPWTIIVFIAVALASAASAITATDLSTDRDLSADTMTIYGGHDPQVGGYFNRIVAATQYSTAGWKDDLWQSFFVIGRLVDEKKALSSEKLAQELFDEIQALVDELEEMITAREQVIVHRRRLGMTLQVPGTEAQRIEAGAVEEMEELALRPLLRQRIAEIKSEGPGELT